MPEVKCLLAIEEIVQLYLDGKSTTEIARLANVTPRTINKYLALNKVERRPHGNWKRRYVVLALHKRKKKS
ncbi:helix-turn-helix domain-containing protein [Shouchella shacheensis]|uniref:helix-turn-helix domain-containing protein n=1 Tax=Shouchella shacheensis TaxID=1649580 RepID=UPI00073FEBE7|nr:helix-turn-helix domain-containing protein [Shouchella shacheensis]